MPQAIIPYLVTYLGPTLAAVVANVAVALVLSITVTELGRLFQGKPGAAGPPPLNVTGRGTTEFRRVVLGTIRCAGSIVFYQTAGATNSQLFIVVVYAGHAVGAETHAYIQGKS